MYQTIGEKISVAGVFDHGKFRPAKFKWGQRVLRINQITLINDVKDGGVRKRFYSVVSEGNLYRLSFNREDEVWQLDEVWYE